mgnify:FL=1
MQKEEVLRHPERPGQAVFFQTFRITGPSWKNHLLFCGARFFSSGYRSYGEKRRAGIRQETKAGPARNKRERLPYSRSTKTGGSGIERRRLEAGTSALAGECEVYRRKERSFFRRHRYPLCTSRPPEVPGKRLPACLLNEM